jgi:hypothetical protein
MHGTLLALALAAYLFATDPSGVLAGPGLDPDGAKTPAHASEAGPGLDPSGHS